MHKLVWQLGLTLSQLHLTLSQVCLTLSQLHLTLSLLGVLYCWFQFLLRGCTSGGVYVP